MSLLHKIALTQISRIGNVRAKNILALCDKDCEKLFSISKKELLQIPGISKTIADIFFKEKDQKLKEAEAELKIADKKNIHLLEYGTENYPKKLNPIYDAPIILYAKGNIQLPIQQTLAVVGTRNITPYGSELCKLTAETLLGWEGVVVSGLALGVDSEIHKCSLEKNIPNIAVLGHGFNTLYPEKHKKLSEKIMETGMLVTEFPYDVQPDPRHFPARNRIIAGLSDAVLVVESKKKGGALITAELAFDYNKEVFCFPGRIFDTCSEGCNQLVQQNKACLINHPNEILKQMNWGNHLHKAPTKLTQASLFENASQDEKQILEIIKHNAELSIDELSLLAKKNVSELALILLELEMQKKISVLPGKRYALRI